MTTMSADQLFIERDTLFSVGKEADGKFVVDIAVDRGVSYDDVQNWARVVGRFETLDNAIAAAKLEISKL